MMMLAVYMEVMRLHLIATMLYFFRLRFSMFSWLAKLTLFCPLLLLPSDAFSSLGNPIGNISNAQVLQYGSSSCLVDNGSKHESSKGRKDGTVDTGEKTQESRKKSTVIMLSVKRKSFDGKILEVCKVNLLIEFVGTF